MTKKYKHLGDYKISKTGIVLGGIFGACVKIR